MTSEGFLKPCLQYAGGVDLRQLIREGADDEALLSAIEDGIYHKPRQHSFTEEESCGELKEDKNMSSIGG